MADMTHIDADGRARMVDISDKPATVREACAEGRLVMRPETVRLALSGGGKKGNVRAVAEVAGVMAAKRTADLIPMCHALMLSFAKVIVSPLEDGRGLGVSATVRTTGPTGVEMEALSAATVALLTLYDMLKAADRGMEIEGVRLVAKSGGASGDWRRGRSETEGRDHRNRGRTRPGPEALGLRKDFALRLIKGRDIAEKAASSSGTAPIVPLAAGIPAL